MREQLEEDVGELLESGVVAEFAQKQEELEASGSFVAPVKVASASERNEQTDWKRLLRWFVRCRFKSLRVVPAPVPTSKSP